MLGYKFKYFATANKIKLMKFFTNKAVPTTIRFIEDYNVEGMTPAQYNLFIVDLNCNNSREILNQVSFILYVDL